MSSRLKERSRERMSESDRTVRGIVLGWCWSQARRLNVGRNTAEV